MAESSNVAVLVYPVCKLSYLWSLSVQEDVHWAHTRPISHQLYHSKYPNQFVSLPILSWV